MLLAHFFAMLSSLFVYRPQDFNGIDGCRWEFSAQVYVASICVHVNPQQAVRALIEADAYPGPSLVLAYAPCISQGFPMAESIQHCQMAVDSGYWPLYRYNPELATQGNNPFQLDSRKIKGDLFKFLAKENRFAAVMRRDPKHAEELDKRLQDNVVQKNHLLQVLNKEDLEGQFHKLVEGLSDAKSSGDSITVLFGSETGNAEEQAKNLVQDLAARGLKATASSLDDFEFEELPNQKMLILVVSTCGLGEYPANSKQTWLKLQSPELPMTWLNGVKFCVFGLGDSTYSQFCVAAVGFDTRLGELGAQRILKRGVGDDRDEDRYYTGWEAGAFEREHGPETMWDMSMRFAFKPFQARLGIVPKCLLRPGSRSCGRSWARRLCPCPRSLPRPATAWTSPPVRWRSRQ